MTPPRIVPPVYFLACLAAMVLLHRFFPVRQLIAWPWRWIGLVGIVGGFGLGGWAAGLFKRRGTTLRPGRESARLVVEGPFRFMRNPMYLGMVIVLCGVAVMLGSATPWVGVPAFVVLIGRNIIPVEEGMLAERFGAEYADYRARVRRWI